MLVTTVDENRDHEFEKEKRGVYGRRLEDEGEMMQLY